MAISRLIDKRQVKVNDDDGVLKRVAFDAIYVMN